MLLAYVNKSRIITILIILVLFPIAVFLLNQFGFFKPAPFHKSTKILSYVYDFPKKTNGALDSDSPTIKQSQEEIKKLKPYLPYYKKLDLSTDLTVSVFISSFDLQPRPYTLQIDINDINYDSSVNDSDYELMKNSFREAASKAIDWIKSTGTDPTKIMIVWGGKEFLRNKSDEWLSID